MESVEGWPHGTPWNESLGGSFFRITDLDSGIILKNVSKSIGHAFFSAVVDGKRDTVWVFGAAHVSVCLTGIFCCLLFFFG